jgi:hypothetical protein
VHGAVGWQRLEQEPRSDGRAPPSRQTSHLNSSPSRLLLPRGKLLWADNLQLRTRLTAPARGARSPASLLQAASTGTPARPMLVLAGGVRVCEAGPEKGRGVYAEGALAAGSLLLREQAFAAAPRHADERCTRCLHSLPSAAAGSAGGDGAGPGEGAAGGPGGRWRACDCQLRFCDRCWAIAGHEHRQTSECQALRAAGAGTTTDSAVLLGLRCHARLGRSAAGPLAFQQLMHAPLDPELRARARALSELLRHSCNEPPPSRSAAAERVVCRLARNALSVGNHRGPAGSALFRCVSMLNHSCSPNAFVWFTFGGDGDEEGRVVAEVRASRAIRTGEEICIAVSSPTHTDLYGHMLHCIT